MSSFVICRLAAANIYQRTQRVRRSVRSADCGGPGECASDVRSRGIAPSRKELRNGSSKSERESTSSRSTNYGSGHLIQVFRDIGRIFSLFVLPSQPPVACWSPAVREGFKSGRRNMISSKAKNGFNCVSRGTHPVKEPGVSFAKNENPAQVRGGAEIAPPVVQEDWGQCPGPR